MVTLTEPQRLRRGALAERGPMAAVELRAGPAATWETWTDLELVQAGGEDLDAFAELIRRHQDFVLGAVSRIVKDRSLAEDLVQEVFLRAFRGLDRFRGDAAVRSWLYRIATNLAMNAATRRREYPSDTLQDRPTSARSPDRMVEAAEMSARLREAIAGLPDDLREPLVLYECDELTYKEIAGMTGLPLNTVRTRIHRARRRLRSEMFAWR